MDILLKIVDYKQSVISSAKKTLPVNSMNLLAVPRNFTAGIKNAHSQNKTAIIAEIKKGSPSRGIICTTFNVAQISQEYENGGASCISVLTDEQFFYGKNENIQIAKENSTLPILRKDFIIDEYQIYESKHLNADAILLIAAILDKKQIEEFEFLAQELGLAVLIETHNNSELEMVLKHTKSPLVGINNRNLRNFEVDVQNTINLLNLIPKTRIPICESGINSKADINLIKQHKCNTFLIGTSIMQSNNRAQFIKELTE